MKKVQAYRASDRLLFETEEQCAEHEVALVWRARIAEFMDSAFCPYSRNTAQHNMAFKIVVAWELFKERTPAKTPADDAPEEPA